MESAILLGLRAFRRDMCGSQRGMFGRARASEARTTVSDGCAIWPDKVSTPPRCARRGIPWVCRGRRQTRKDARASAQGVWFGEQGGPLRAQGVWECIEGLRRTSERLRHTSEGLRRTRGDPLGPHQRSPDAHKPVRFAYDSIRCAHRPNRHSNCWRWFRGCGWRVVGCGGWGRRRRQNFIEDAMQIHQGAVVGCGGFFGHQ